MTDGGVATGVSTGGRSSLRGSWRRTAAFYRLPGVVVLALSLGLATGRADVVIIAAPLLLGGIAALLATRPLLGSRAPSAQSAVDAESFGRNTVDVVTTVTGTDGVELISVAQPHVDRGPIGAMVTIPGGAPEAVIRTRFRTRNWGMTDVARPDSLGIGPDGLYLAGAVRYAPVRRDLILPEVTALAPLQLPPIVGGWAGAHVSRRPGQGSDLIDLREFAPGDKLRSIHWRSYARHHRLYTRRTLSDAEAELMICLDLSTIMRPRNPRIVRGRMARLAAQARGTAQQVVDWLVPGGREQRRRLEAAERRLDASSIDHSVAAAAAVAAAHLRQGDRVGLMAATVSRRLLRPGTGNRQLQRIRYQLALLDERRYRMLDVGWWGLRPGQIVVWCSPMTSQASMDAAIDCAARGHRVMVVDTLPTFGILARSTAVDADHLRIVMVERQLRLDRLRGRGIGVVSWDAGDVDAQLLDAARTMRRRR